MGSAPVIDFKNLNINSVYIYLKIYTVFNKKSQRA